MNAERAEHALTSQSGVGGKSSIRPAVNVSSWIFLVGAFARRGGTLITFQRALNLNLASADAAYSCEQRLTAPYRQKVRIAMELKGVVAAPSQLRTIGAPGIAAKQPN
jgi:hypothetical protein